jgi:Zn-dependent protease/predicted transcriptional regulator
MKWSLKLGRILGIDVYLHVTFLLLLAFIGLTQVMAGRTVGSAVGAVAYFATLFGCVLLHEFGHALAARQYGIRTHDIILLPIGGVARLERMPEKPSQELVVAIAGPLVNLVIAGGLFVGLNLRGWEPNISLLEGSIAERLLVVNVFLMLFNLLPAFPMDGGRVLRAILAMRVPYARATRIAASIGQGMAFVFGFIGLIKFWPMLLLIALFVWIGAAQEAAAVEFRSNASSARVRDAMLTHFRSLAPGQNLADAARHLLAGSQQDFPVIEDGRLVGILYRKDLFRALQEQGDSLPVAAIMRRNLEVVTPEELLDAALSRVHADQGTTMAVLQNGQLTGLLTAENVGEFFMIQAALERNRHTHSHTRHASVPPVIAVYSAQARRAQ